MLILPLLITNVLHMFVVKQNLFAFANYPINQVLLGRNKTYRGLLFITIVNIASYYFVKNIIYNIENPYETLFIGGILGLAYAIAELPNSYMKRKLNIAPGTRPSNNKLVFALLDKSDSAFVTSITYVLLLSLGIKEWFILFIVSVFTHITVSWLLLITKNKKSF